MQAKKPQNTNNIKSKAADDWLIASAVDDIYNLEDSD
jgi:hypothetical protein